MSRSVDGIRDAIGVQMSRRIRSQPQRQYYLRARYQVSDALANRLWFSSSGRILAEVYVAVTVGRHDWAQGARWDRVWDVAWIPVLEQARSRLGRGILDQVGPARADRILRQVVAPSLLALWNQILLGVQREVAGVLRPRTISGVRRELARQVRDQVLDQVLARLRAQAQEQLQTYVGDPVYHWVWAEIREQLAARIAGTVRVRVNTWIGGQAWIGVAAPVWREICAPEPVPDGFQHIRQVLCRLGAQVRNQAGSRTGDQVEGLVRFQTEVQAWEQLEARVTQAVRERVRVRVTDWGLETVQAETRREVTARGRGASGRESAR